MPYRYSKVWKWSSLALEAAAALLPPWGRPARGRDPRRIVLLEPFQMGDVLSLAVLLDPLRQRFPGAEIWVWTQPKNAEVFQRDPRVAGAIVCPFPWTGYGDKGGSPALWRGLLWGVRQARALRFDAGFDARGDIRSQILLKLIGCPVRVGHTNYMASNIRLRGSLLTHGPGHLPVVHRWEMHRLVLSAWLGRDLPAPVLPVFRADGLPPAPAPPAGRRRVVLHTGGGWQFKRWAPERWRGLLEILARRADLQLVLVGGPGEGDGLRQLLDGINLHPEAVEARETTFDELIALLRSAALFIGLDSGPMNLACTLGVPVLALFGPGDSAVWHPLAPGSAYLHAKDGLACNPCPQTTCVVPENSCMARIEVSAAAALALRLLAE